MAQFLSGAPQIAHRVIHNFSGQWRVAFASEGNVAGLARGIGHNPSHCWPAASPGSSQFVCLSAPELIPENLLLSIIQAAGWPIWPLILCSIVALALVIERLYQLRASLVAPASLLEEVIGFTRASLPAASASVAVLRSACRTKMNSSSSKPVPRYKMRTARKPRHPRLARPMSKPANTSQANTEKIVL